jgi:hypothetical protein
VGLGPDGLQGDPEMEGEIDILRAQEKERCAQIRKRVKTENWRGEGFR